VPRDRGGFDGSKWQFAGVRRFRKVALVVRPFELLAESSDEDTGMPGQTSERYHLHPPLPEEVSLRVANADDILLYSLLPSSEPGKEDVDRFHTYPILDSVQVVDQNHRTAVYAALRAGAEAGTLGRRRWQPHHGVRISQGGRTLDFVICFICECMQVFVDLRSDEFKWADISNRPEATLDELLAKAGHPPN
jgi:hypothetical protein